jgi:hypothetical protein
MTYTFKLARRLAILRDFAMIAALALFAACASDKFTAPGELSNSNNPTWRSPKRTQISVQVNPHLVTIETNQVIRFSGHARTPGGDSLSQSFTWMASGGSITSDGAFSSSAPGTFKVMGRMPGTRNKHHSDSSQVVVVPAQPGLQSLSIAPEAPTILSGASQAFTATAKLIDGTTTTAIGLVWSAVGGTIDPAGNYTAGTVTGTYPVIASNTAGTISDTVRVTIAPATPQTAPTLSRVFLTPASVSLSPGATKRFAAYGRDSAGDSIPITVSYKATGGTITSQGLYTAGPTSGTYGVIATSTGIADTAVVTVTSALGSPTVSPAGSSYPFGPAFIPLDSMGRPGMPYSASLQTAYTLRICSELSRMRAVGRRIGYSVGRGKSKNEYNQLDVAAVKAEVQAWKSACPSIGTYVTDGTLAFIYVTDEPSCASCWGWTADAPPISKEQMARKVDSLALWVKNIIGPATPTIARMPPSAFPFSPQWLDAAWASYVGPIFKGNPETYRDTQIADAKARGLKLVLGMTTLDGGCGDTNGAACRSIPIAGSGIAGTYRDGSHWQMSVPEVLRYGTILIGAAKSSPTVCGYFHWMWSTDFGSYFDRPAGQLAAIESFDGRADVRAAMDSLGRLAREIPARSCTN